MTSSSYMLERELLGSARNIIDAHSNAPFTSQPQQSNYRGSYGTTSPLPYANTTTNYNSHSYANGSTENHESKKALADVG
jgi:hypothetical protein